MNKYNTCIFKIYQKPEDYYRYFCKVTAGKLNTTGKAPVFEPIKDIYDIPLSGPGRNKALKKIREKLKDDSLEISIIKDLSNIRILDRK
ncbi:MAG: hypothetical protein Q7S56_01240 [Nanoarchaeota archaeon]|nr:hypothetical protein [Nanoarchaeota archaeon]